MLHPSSFLLQVLVIALAASLWFSLGFMRLKKVPLIRDPLMMLRHSHPRLALPMAILLILFWPLDRWIWRVFCGILNHRVTRK
jgi:hypothetical protein